MIQIYQAIQLSLFPLICLVGLLWMKYQRDRHNRLLDAVEDLYYAAHWTPDRECDADRLWRKLRDAAEWPPGRAPKPQDLSTTPKETKRND